MLAITVAVAMQPKPCLACKTKTFCTSDIKTSYCLHYDLETLKCHYMKTSCSISFKLTVFNSDTFSFLNVNFLRDQMSFNVVMNLYNIH